METLIVPPERTNSQIPRKSGANKSKVARSFHEQEFRTWIREKLSFAQLAERIQVNPDTVAAWARKENWEGLLKEIAEAARKKIVLSEAEKLARIKNRQQKISRKAQLAIWKLLTRGQISIDIFGNVVRSKENPDQPERRELIAGELNQAVQALSKAADLEYHRAGGQLAPTGPVDVRFPDLVGLLEKLWKERNAAPKVVDGQVIERQPIALPRGVDPREEM